MSTSIHRSWFGAKAKLLLFPLAVALALGVALGARGDTKQLAAAATAPTTDAPARRMPALPEAPSLAGVWMLLLALAAGGIAVVVIAKRKGLTRAGTGHITVVDTVALGPKRFVHLVRCADRRFLLANSEGGITCIATLPQEFHEAEIDALAQNADATDEFRRLLEPAGAKA